VKRSKIITKLTGIMLVSFFSFNASSQNIPSHWEYGVIGLDEIMETTPPTSPILIAVVDDGFLLTHDVLKDFIYTKTSEVAGNQLDDDGDGRIDDTNGWDVSDLDNDPSVSQGLERTYYHGTYIAGIIAQLAKQVYGEAANQYIQILPIKALSDYATNTYVKDGYKGIQYAIDNKADIVCMAWSGGDPSQENLSILSQAQKEQVLLIGSTGNFQAKTISFPSSHPSVFAISATNSFGEKHQLSNYGMEVAISAPGEYIKGPHPDRYDAYIHESGTSPATAIVAACAAILKSQFPELSNDLIKEALLNTANPHSVEDEYAGKMGAGIVNLKAALDYLRSENRQGFHSENRTKGTLTFNKEGSNKLKISPSGSHHGFFLSARTDGMKNPDRQTMSIRVADSLWNSYSLAKLPAVLFVPSQNIEVEVSTSTFSKKDLFKIGYKSKPVDSTTLYCEGVKTITTKEIIDDGSGIAPYANECSCKWQIIAPIGKRIRFTFTEMATEPNVDFVYLVDGKTAIPENFIAKFSGSNLPPTVTSRTNEVLVWFLTDDKNVGQGWEFEYEFVD